MKGPTRREFLGALGSAAVALPGLGVPASAAEGGKRPNVILILSDDQGYGDFGCYGNQQIHTPALDRFYREGVRFSNFYVQPVCSPTRACLMTGRYLYRSGLIDTWVGVSMMRPNEVTVAQALSKHAGYRTGIFGKWHLGDHYPLRPIDNGFDEAIVCKGGGVGQIDDPIDNHYSDPIFYHNGKPEQYHGYCTDIFFDGAMQFIEANRDHPFFIYIPTNVVHEPLEVPEKYAAPYRAMGLSEDLSKLYGMVTNLDENVGKLFKKLQSLGLDENTVVIFLSDNGPGGPKRYNVGLRGVKGQVYEGGIKTPFFVRWPERLKAGRDIDRIGAHIDVFPTILDICGVTEPTGLKLDGKSLLPLMTGEAANWPDRTLFIQQSRPDQYGWNVPRPYTHCAARGQRYKIVMSAPGRETFSHSVGMGETELYDIEQDPGELHNIAQEHPEIIFQMRNRYEDWFWDVTKGLEPPVRNHLGTSYENPVNLGTQDMRGPHAHLAPWNWAQVHRLAATEPNGSGHYEVEVARSGRYEITFRFGPLGGKNLPVMKRGTAYLSLGDVTMAKKIADGDAAVAFSANLKAGRFRLDPLLTGQRSDGRAVSPFFVDVKYMGT
jgi:arylsulfatase A-like enzyme